MSIKRQELTSLGDDKGTVHLRTTVSLDEAIDETIKTSEYGNRIGSGSDEVVVAAQIPDELFTYDPLLKKALIARKNGDIAEYTHYIRSFLKINPQFVPLKSRKYF